jgi:nucleotidyltransferase/DNA polymerase involved in DNA repair
MSLPSAANVAACYPSATDDNAGAVLSPYTRYPVWRLGSPEFDQDERPVRADRTRKSLGAENTFSADIFTFEAACDALQPIIEKVWRTCERAEIRGRTVTLKVKYTDFQQITRSRTGQALFSTRAEIEQLSYALLCSRLQKASAFSA